MTIRTSTLALAVIAGLTLSGCDKLPIPGLKQIAGATANTLPLDKEVRGELTSSSGLNYNDGSRHQVYTLNLEANQAVELQLGGALNGGLAVFKGPLLVASTQASEYGSSGNSLAFRSTEAGAYTVAVNGSQASAYGPYQLTAKPIAAYDGKPLSPGEHAIDWLINERQEYQFTIATAGVYVITAESSNFDTVLTVSGRGVEEENDDGGNNLNSRLQLFLEPGQYTASVRSMGESSGSFKLAIGTSSLEPGTVVRDGSELPLNRRINGLVGSEGVRSFSFTLAQNSRVSFDARSSDFDTVLEVSGNGITAEDDDGGNGTNSRLDLNLAAGSYTVDVRSLGGNSGSFTLQASAATASPSGSAAADAIDAAAAATAE
ncbi:ABC transporter substrate-binding protein [Stenotrophomonas koreensis]|uniref:ABC transporter substrate-binding protein n=1 Tax=Stenotrophomonas koreensis TaxID=266128 RepID=UPI0033907A17